MDALDKKIVQFFPGKSVRKDITLDMKQQGNNVPTFVLEYLLGMYCSTDNEDAINLGKTKINKVLCENYVRPDQSEYIKSKIKENGTYLVIDKISAYLDEKEDKYIARFTNLRIAPFPVDQNLVYNNEKLLLGGIWCIVNISYNPKKQAEEDEDEEEEILFGNKKSKKKIKEPKSKYSEAFKINSLKPIQMPNLNFDEILKARPSFTKDEWIDVLIRSAGYEPSKLTQKEKFHYLLRFVPLAQKNFNLVELGSRNTGKSHVYSELSPYSILMSGGTTTVANMFYNLGRHTVGLVGHWDCIAFDEVGGLKNADMNMINFMKNYMANASFAKGQNTITADASIVFGGNIFKPVDEMLKYNNLFEPFPELFNNDSAFFDRIHAYLPGWETPKLKSSLLTTHFGLITDCLSEYCHILRKYTFTDLYEEYFSLNRSFNGRDETAVKRTFSGLAKLIYPNGVITKEEAKELLEYAIECRRRVKEQLKKMTAVEFSDVDLGYIDNDSKEETIIYLPEQPKSSLVSSKYEKAGYVYAIGRSYKETLGVYRLENKLLDGKGDFLAKNIEGIGGHITVRQSLLAAFNMFTTSISKISNAGVDEYDYSMFFNDLQNKGVSDEVSVAEVVGLSSALLNIPVKPSTVIVGRVVMSGSMMPLSTGLLDIVSYAVNAGANNILLPADVADNFAKLSQDITNGINAIFYRSPIDAVIKALGLGNNYGTK